jgi:hypothetical protein
VEETRKAFHIFCGKYGKLEVSLSKFRCKYENNIRVDFPEIEC